jgi:polyisoprenoid-binding protein YceI
MAILWKIDPAHSEILFKVKHLMITTVTGYFRTFDLEVETETDDFHTMKRLVFTADIESIDTKYITRKAFNKLFSTFRQTRWATGYLLLLLLLFLHHIQIA